jgi:hypothetical protein
VRASCVALDIERAGDRKEKAARRRLSIQFPGIVDQATIDAGFGFRRYVALADDAS